MSTERSRIFDDHLDELIYSAKTNCFGNAESFQYVTKRQFFLCADDWPQQLLSIFNDKGVEIKQEENTDKPRVLKFNFFPNKTRNSGHAWIMVQTINNQWLILQSYQSIHEFRKGPTLNLETTKELIQILCQSTLTAENDEKLAKLLEIPQFGSAAYDFQTKLNVETTMKTQTLSTKDKDRTLDFLFGLIVGISLCILATSRK